MISRFIMAASLAMTLVTSTAVGETFTFEERNARFQLFSDCGPMRLVVEEFPEAAKKIGLTEESIQAAGESRLRSARLYSAVADPYLYINVNVAGGGFNVGLEYKKWVSEYKKWVSDPLSGEEMPATTWDTGSTGTHGRDPGFILSTASGLLDLFLVEFLRVNEEACGKR